MNILNSTEKITYTNLNFWMTIMHDIITHSHPVCVISINKMRLGGVRDFKWNRPQELRTLIQKPEKRDKGKKETEFGQKDI